VKMEVDHKHICNTGNSEPNVSTKLGFLSFNNTRDLGGMKTADGRSIVKNKLIRSGNLHGATESDIKFLSENVDCIVDLRTDTECGGMPDPEVAGAKNVHISILPNLAAGVSRDKKSDDEAFFKLKDDPDDAGRYMARIYDSFVANEFSVGQYRRFIDLLLEPRKGAILWHCTVGKDRTGVGAVIIEHILGITKEDIISDYLLTNEYIRDEQMKMVESVGFKTGGKVDEKQRKAFDWLFGAHKEYIDSLYRKAEELYGSFDGFLSKRLGVTEEEREKLKGMYLE